MTRTQLAVVAVDSPLENLTYLQNENFKAERGDVVNIPLGARTESGIVLKTFDEDASIVDNYEYKLKPLKSLNEDLPKLPEPCLLWLEWMSEYYIYPLGRVAQLCFPPLEKAKKLRKNSNRSIRSNTKRFRYFIKGKN